MKLPQNGNDGNSAADTVVAATATAAAGRWGGGFGRMGKGGGRRSMNNENEADSARITRRQQ